MKRLLQDKAGSIPVIFIGLVFFILSIAFLIMEMGAVYENYYDAETILQRSCNSAVEKNMLDAYRADNILRLTYRGKIGFSQLSFFRYAGQIHCDGQFHHRLGSAPGPDRHGNGHVFNAFWAIRLR
jgi:hypothetical protein